MYHVEIQDSTKDEVKRMFWQPTEQVRQLLLSATKTQTIYVFQLVGDHHALFVTHEATEENV